MGLRSRTSVVCCDQCGIESTLHHDLAYSVYSGYAFNKALDEAGWSEPFDSDVGYMMYCKECTNLMRLSK